MALTDYVFQSLQAVRDKNTSVQVTRAFERFFPRNRATNITAALTLNEAVHEGQNKILTINSAAGININLPASTGQGAKYRFVVGTTVTSSALTIKVANVTDIMQGNILQTGAAGATTSFKAAAADDTVSMNGSTTGGIKGDYLEFEDVSINLWAVRAVCAITGVAATPWAATV